MPVIERCELFWIRNGRIVLNPTVIPVRKGKYLHFYPQDLIIGQTITTFRDQWELITAFDVFLAGLLRRPKVEPGEDSQSRVTVRTPFRALLQSRKALLEFCCGSWTTHGRTAMLQSRWFYNTGKCAGTKTHLVKSIWNRRGRTTYLEQFQPVVMQPQWFDWFTRLTVCLNCHLLPDCQKVIFRPR